MYNVVDVFFAGLIGTEAQAGLAISFQAFFLFITFGFGLSSAMTALVGNALGAKRPDEARLVAARGIGYGAIISLMLMVGAWFVGPELIKLVSSEGAYRDAGTRYFRVLLLAMPGFVMSFGINGLLQSQGDTVSMQRGQIAAFFANIALNPLGCQDPGCLGWHGVRRDRAVDRDQPERHHASMSVTGCSGLIFWPVSHACFRPESATYRAITTQMLPTTMTMFVMMSAGFIVQYYLKSFGTSAVAAYGVALRVEQLFLLPVFGLTTALLPIAAQNWGRHERPCSSGAVRLLEVRLDVHGGCVSNSVLRLAVSDADLHGRSGSYPDRCQLPSRRWIHSADLHDAVRHQFISSGAETADLDLLDRGLQTGFRGCLLQLCLCVWGGFGVLGVWFGIATAVISGWLISLIVAEYVARGSIGSLGAMKAMEGRV